MLERKGEGECTVNLLTVCDSRFEALDYCCGYYGKFWSLSPIKTKKYRAPLSS